jgi:hypothetical protein
MIVNFLDVPPSYFLKYTTHKLLSFFGGGGGAGGGSGSSTLPHTDLDAGDDGDNNEPEPEEDVDLLVDDVEGEDAQRVKLLHRAGGAELVELALCHLEQRRFQTGV